MSLPRFLAVLFPIFMWLALWCEERRATERVAALSALGPGPVHRAVRHLALDLVTRAVLLDALGTLVELQPPAPRLRRLLADAGFEVSEERAAAGFGAEIAYYLEHHLEGADRRVARRPARPLRGRRCCAALELPGLDHATARRAMLEALEFTRLPRRALLRCASCASAGMASWS